MKIANNLERPKIAGMYLTEDSIGYQSWQYFNGNHWQSESGHPIAYWWCATVDILNTDCMEYMKGLPDKYFDLAIIDPPYGISEADGRNHSRTKAIGSKTASNNRKGYVVPPTKYTIKEWDKCPPTHKYFEELFRVSKNQIVFGANHFMSRLYIAAPMMKDIDSSCWIVWDKDNTGDFADCELAWTSFNTAVRKFKFRWNGMLQEDMKNKEERIHPTQKPVKLYQWILLNYAKEGDKILDTHGGSMSSAIACHQMGFDLVLCEIDKDYYEAGVKRYSDAIKQLKLL